jgi:hypothetical protein
MNNLSDIFSAKANYVWQLSTGMGGQPASGRPAWGDGDPMVTSVFSETLMASPSGIVAKNAFVFAHGKHPTRNFFVFYRKDIGDMIFDPQEANPKQIGRQEWMDKEEEDAMAELDAKAADPSAELEESLLEMILGFRSK